MTHAITILHSLPNRLRIKFSSLLVHQKALQEMVMEHIGMLSFTYNSQSGNALINFDKQKIAASEVLIRISVAYSIENKLAPIRITQSANKKMITGKSIFALLSIGAASIASFMPTLFMRYGTALNWIAALSTGAAVVEHAAIDFRKKGSVDPEVISIVYLANQALNFQKFIVPSALTWVATFGRHLSNREKEGINLGIRKLDVEKEKTCYEVFISQYNSSANFIEVLNSLASGMVSGSARSLNSIYDSSKELVRKHEGALEGIGKHGSNIVLTFNN